MPSDDLTIAFIFQSPGRRRRSSSFSPHMPVLSPKRLKIVDEAEMVKERRRRDRRQSTSKIIFLKYHKVTLFVIDRDFSLHYTNKLFV